MSVILYLPKKQRTFEGELEGLWVFKAPFGGVWNRNFLANHADRLDHTVLDGAKHINALNLDIAGALERRHGFVHGVSTHATEADTVHVKDIVSTKRRNFVVNRSHADTDTRIVTALTWVFTIALDDIDVVDVEVLYGSYREYR